MQVGNVIYIEFPSKSFSRANGIKIVVEVRENTINYVSLDNKGKLSLFDDGKYKINITGINNSGISIIKGLSYDVDSSLL